MIDISFSTDITNYQVQGMGLSLLVLVSFSLLWF